MNEQLLGDTSLLQAVSLNGRHVSEKQVGWVV